MNDGGLTRSRVAGLLAVGLVAGLFSGLFGIGGGIVVVPALVVVLGLDHRHAVGTSLVAILPAALVSLISYWVASGVDLGAGLLLAVGAVGGAQLGARVLERLSRRAAQWVFVAFVVVMVVQLALVLPNRDATLHLDVGVAIGLVALGTVAGVMSTLLGVGGGGIVVPVLMLAFGMGDVGAKGASLLMMIPGTASGLVANLRRGTADVRAGAVVGVAAVLTGPLGAWIAHAVPPRAGALLFAAFLLVVGVSMAREALRADPTP